MNPKVAEESQKLEQDTIVALYEIDAREWGYGVLYFTNQTDEEGNPLSFNGFVYTPIAVTCKGFTWSVKGAQARPTFTLPAVDATVMSLLIGADNLTGAPVKRIMTYRKHLDDGSDPDPEAIWPNEYYRIERMSERSSKLITFELSNKLVQTDRQIPARQCVRDTCTHTYRYWDGEKFVYKGVTCPYAGNMMYDLQGIETNDPDKDICSKDLTKGCRRRFGNGVLPFRGFPGLARS